MKYPIPIENRAKIEPKLGIKSSLDSIRSIIALMYILYVVNNRKSRIEYSELNSSGGIKLKVTYFNKIQEYFSDFNIDNLENLINKNPLILNQIEPLYVGITLLLRLGKIINDGRSERTSNIRTPKTIMFSNNIILLDLILMGFDNKELKQNLLMWLNNKKATSLRFEESLGSFISISIQNTACKLRIDDEELIFNTEGIYKALVKSPLDDAVCIKDSKEMVGPTRIYNNILKEELDPWLSYKDKMVKFSKFKLFGDLDAYNYTDIITTSLDLNNVELNNENITNIDNIYHFNTNKSDNVFYKNYLTAIRTKPFLLLAGISGTGKSRIVKQLAYMSCPNYGGLRDCEVAPGNYCMIEVKPNWHDSTELLGYESVINQKYVLTPFVKFLIKAMQFPNVPFFVCLDEMNLAPVEQYFAEFLSVLESRKRVGDKIVSEPLIKGDIFRNYEVATDDIKSLREELEMGSQKVVEDSNCRLLDKVYDELKRDGLCIPQNVIVVGTVNMDETTHQFSRKVIDRAMTIEMNIGEDKEKYFEDFFESNVGLGYYDVEMQKELFLSSYTSATEAMEDNENDAEEIKRIVPNLLAQLNMRLKNTPFEVAYRVQNELIIYICELRREHKDMGIEELIAMAMDDILMMKVLPRIEGDDSLLKEPLKELLEFCKDKYPKAYKKIDEMNTRLESHFTSYWP